MSATATTSQPRANTRPAILAILAISAAASLFLFWLIYEHPAADTTSTKLAFLPALNAALNGLSATALLVGYTFIRARKIAAHRASMITAFIFSTLFLVSYILHHYLHGDVRYPLHAAMRSIYLPLLASHIVLAVIALAPGAGHVFLLAHRPHSAASQGCALDISHLALRLGHRRNHLRDAAPRAGIVSRMPVIERVPASPKRIASHQRRHPPAFAMGFVHGGRGSARHNSASDTPRRIRPHRRQHQHRLVRTHRRAHVHPVWRTSADPRHRQMAPQPQPAALWHSAQLTDSRSSKSMPIRPPH